MASARYRLKRALMTPLTAYRRRKFKLDGVAKTIAELHYYSTAVQDFARATIAKPEILVDFDLNESSVVLDVGAFVGQWAQKVRAKTGSVVLAFEPNPIALRSLRKAYAEDDGVRVFGYGLGARDETAALALAGPGSSIYEKSGPYGEVEVQIRDVAGVLSELGIERYGLLKVNIEGGEYDLFDRLGDTGWLDRMDRVLVQFHEWHPGAYRRRRRVRRRLSDSHREVWNYPWIYEYWRHQSLEPT